MSIFKRLTGTFSRRETSTSADYDQPPKKRIAAFLVLMQSKRDDGHELCERLLDLKQADLGAKPRRFFIDLDTWYDYWWAEPSLPIIPSISRILDHTAEEYEIAVVAQMMKRLHEASAVKVSADAMRLHKFTYDGEDGATMMILEDRAVRPTTKLRCRKCGKTFDFSTTADMASIEQVYQFFLSAGQDVVVHESNLDHPSPDLVAESSGPERGRVAKEALVALRSGKYRRWHHQGCDAVLGYPGAFFRTGL